MTGMVGVLVPVVVVVVFAVVVVVFGLHEEAGSLNAARQVAGSQWAVVLSHHPAELQQLPWLQTALPWVGPHRWTTGPVEVPLQVEVEPLKDPRQVALSQ